MTVTDVQEEPTLPIPGPTPPAAVEADSDAPWGRKADGSPKAKPGAKPRAAGPRAAAAPGPKTGSRSTAGTSSKKAAGVDYRPAILGLGHLPIGIASMAARLIPDERKRQAVQLDAITVKVHLPGVAEAVNNLAQTNAKVAATLDRIVSVGPYGELFAAVSPIVLQCLVNHRMMPPNPEIGLLAPEQLLAAAA